MPPREDDVSERSLAPISRDLGFYLTLLFFVLPLWSIPPLSWIYVCYSLATGALWSYHPPRLILLAIALAEAFFSIYSYNLARFVSGPSPIPSGEMSELQATFNRVLQTGLANFDEDGIALENIGVDRPGSPAENIVQLEANDPRAIDFRNSLRTWFGKVPWSHIHQHEMRVWLYWAIFNAHLPDSDAMPHTHRKFIDEALELIEKRAGTVLPAGSNPAAKPILLTLDPVNYAWRPLMWYLFVGATIYMLKHILVVYHGMRTLHKDGIDYLIYVPKGWTVHSNPMPVVFMHGLGLGLLQYFSFIKHLRHRMANRPLLVPLQPQISQMLFHPRFLTPPGRKETAEATRSLLVDLGWVKDDEDMKVDEILGSSASKTPGVTLLSHSNGSFVHAWILKAHPNLVARSCFIDPVTFCSWEGDVCYNFLYRRPSTALHLLMYYFVGSELGVTNVLQRHFDWSSNSLYFEEIPNARDPFRTKFFLGGRDAILSAHRVKKYLTSHGVHKSISYDPDGHHGSTLLDGSPGFSELFRWLNGPEH